MTVWDVIAKIGGISAFLIILFKILADYMGKRLEKKLIFKLDKELATYKSLLENKRYISKTKFDAEFEIYRELSKAFFEMVKDVSVMIPNGLTTYPCDKEERREHENKLYDEALKSCVFAQDILNGNAPFISEDFFNMYNEIVRLCRSQLSAFERRWNVSYVASQSKKESFSQEEYKRTSEIKDKFYELNNKVRDYLSNLDVTD